jgi:hypothetical protein
MKINIQEILKQFDKLYFSKENEKYKNKSIRVIEIEGKLYTQEDYIKYELNKRI